MMFVTAYGALIEDAKVNKGDFVLVPAASSSVGLAAIQIANYAGATSIALTRTSRNRGGLLCPESPCRDGRSRFIINQTCVKRWFRHSFRHPR